MGGFWVLGFRVLSRIEKKTNPESELKTVNPPRKNTCFSFSSTALFFLPHLGRRRGRAIVARARGQKPPAGVTEADQPLVAAVEPPARGERRRARVREGPADRDRRRDGPLAGQRGSGAGREVGRVGVGQEAERGGRLRGEEVHRSVFFFF